MQAPFWSALVAILVFTAPAFADGDGLTATAEKANEAEAPIVEIDPGFSMNAGERVLAPGTVQSSLQEATSPPPLPNLDGHKFCREIITRGLDGKIVGKRKHCLDFAAGELSDDLNAMWGNGPQDTKYRLHDLEIQLKFNPYRDWDPSGYVFDGKNVKDAEGNVFTKE